MTLDAALGLLLSAAIGLMMVGIACQLIGLAILLLITPFRDGWFDGIERRWRFWREKRRLRADTDAS